MMCWWICHNASAKVPPAEWQINAEQQAVGPGEKWSQGCWQRDQVRLCSSPFPQTDTPKCYTTSCSWSAHVWAPSWKQTLNDHLFYLWAWNTQNWFKWNKRLALQKRNGGERYLHSSCVIFSHCALFVLHHFCRVEAVLTLWCFPTFYLWSVTGQSLPQPQSPGWAGHPTSEEPVQLLLERVSLNNVFQVLEIFKSRLEVEIYSIFCNLLFFYWTVRLGQLSKRVCCWLRTVSFKNPQ